MSELHPRVLAGLVEGRIVSDIGVNKLAVLSTDDLPSVAEATSLLSSFLSRSGGVGRIFLDYEDVLDYDPHVTALVARDPTSLSHQLSTVTSTSSDVFVTLWTSEFLDNVELPSDRDTYFVRYDPTSSHLLLLKWEETPSVLFEYNVPAELVKYL